MKIRTATPQDAAAVQAIYAPIVLHTPISFEVEPPTVAEMERRITGTLARFPWFVGEDDAGRVNGYVYASAHQERAAYRWAVNVTAYVREDCRGQKVGQRLYRRLLEELGALGYRQACAGITLPNDASVALHESVGFKLVGVYRSIGFKFGAWRDVGWWQCELQPAGGAGEPEEPRAFGEKAG
ncbi:MAG: N-acetyltransferase family protein [Burkholderiales bacterium]|nr:N-acetyltransferase family protein [Burkholderiales bacterium]